MSGIAGIFNLDGRPVDKALLESMSEAIAHRGPDEETFWLQGPYPKSNFIASFSRLIQLPNRLSRLTR